MTNILLSLSLGINLLLTTLVVNFLLTYPFDIDKVRSTYLKDIRYETHNGCMEGMEYHKLFPDEENRFGENSPVNWCYKYVESRDQIYMQSAYYIGKKK